VNGTDLRSERLSDEFLLSRRQTVYIGPAASGSFDDHGHPVRDADQHASDVMDLALMHANFPRAGGTEDAGPSVRNLDFRVPPHPPYRDNRIRFQSDGHFRDSVDSYPYPISGRNPCFRSKSPEDCQADKKDEQSVRRAEKRDGGF
jgi:hypothetical protein